MPKSNRAAPTWEVSPAPTLATTNRRAVAFNSATPADTAGYIDERGVDVGEGGVVGPREMGEIDQQAAEHASKQADRNSREHDVLAWILYILRHGRDRIEAQIGQRRKRCRRGDRAHMKCPRTIERLDREQPQNSMADRDIANRQHDETQQHDAHKNQQRLVSQRRRSNPAKVQNRDAAGKKERADQKGQPGSARCRESVP